MSIHESEPNRTERLKRTKNFVVTSWDAVKTYGFATGQEGVTKSDADYRDGISHAKRGNPRGVSETKPKQAVQSDKEIAAVPPAHRQREGNQDTFN